jgi:hypothetical protein
MTERQRLYVVVWTDRTGRRHASPPMARQDAEALAAHYDALYPWIEHRVEEAEDE